MFDFNIGLENFAAAEHSVLFVCLMGLGTVFVGLICLILICRLMVVFRKKEEQPKEAAAPIVVQPAAERPIENKQELIAAISAALAEELGTDVSGIRITSFKKL